VATVAKASGVAQNDPQPKRAGPANGWGWFGLAQNTSGPLRSTFCDNRQCADIGGRVVTMGEPGQAISDDTQTCGSRLEDSLLVRRGWYVWPAMSAVAALAVVVGSRISLAHSPGRLFAVPLTLLGTAVLVALPGVATVAALSRRTTSTSTRLGLLLAGAGVAAFADFWAWVASPTFGRLVAVALIVASAILIAAVAPKALLDDPELHWPLLLGLLVALAYTGLAYSQGGLTGAHWLRGAVAGNATDAISYRFWLAPDNTVPYLFAERLAAHTSLRDPLIGDWLTSDRPPLQTGFVLETYPFLGNRVLASQLLGTALEATWVPAAWILLRSRGFSAARVAVVVLSTALTGAVFFNTVYVWPKMLAAAFALVAFTVLLERGSLVLAVALAALALLCHGGIVFSVLALIPFAWRLRPTRRTLAAMVAVGAAVYLPWEAYQHFLDPPGNRLLKWMLAGLTSPDHNSFGHDLVTQYTASPIHSFLLNKLFNVKVLFVGGWRWSDFSATPMWQGFVGDVRTGTVSAPVFAAGPLVLGLLGLASSNVRSALRNSGPLFGFLLLSIAFWVLLMFGGGYATSTLLHQGPYAALVMFVALSALATTFLHRYLAGTLLLANAAWFLIAWLPGFGLHPVQPGIAVRIDWSMVLLAAVSAVAIGVVTYRFTATAPGGPDTKSKKALGTVGPVPLGFWC
jgi:hypothetical protein